MKRYLFYFFLSICFIAGGAQSLPAKYTCDGQNISPPLS